MKEWSVAKLNKENAGRISEEYGLPAIVAMLLDVRGLSDDIESFVSDEAFIDDPFEIKDMDKAVERIKLAIDNGEKICVYGDFDADGVSATALLYSYLETVGADVCYYIPERESEGYGMNKAAVDIINNMGVALIVTVDTGISAVEEIAYANSLGIDTVVTDHHVVGKTLPDAAAVVDLHRPDCNSRFKLISGVGVAFKLVMAIEGEYADVDMLLDNYADLVCIGTIGDIVELRDENRVFVKRGLMSINNGDRAGIRALCEASGYKDKPVNAGNISFTLVPRINAVGRLGQSKDSVSLLLTEDYEKALEIAHKLSDDNAERQRIERQILEEINRNTKKFKMPKAWFYISVKVIAPLLLIGFFVWNMFGLITKLHGVYGSADGYSLTSNIVLGWVVSAVVILFGIIFSIVESVKFKDGRYDPVPWDECTDADDLYDFENEKAAETKE